MNNILALTAQQFFEKITWSNWIDIAVFILVSILISVFLIRRRNLGLVFIYILGVLTYLSVYGVSVYFGNNTLALTLKILDYTTILALIIFVMVYSQAFKNMINNLTLKKESGKNLHGESEENLTMCAGEIVRACQNMAKNDVGALIIIARSSVPEYLLNTGTTLGADVSAGLLESIFSTKGPLHDGAVFIDGGKILSAACFLPLSQEVGIAKELGTRHRAAIGVTESTDLFAIVVSEESGIISVVKDAQIKRYMTPEKLLEEIKVAYGLIVTSKVERKRERRFL